MYYEDLFVVKKLPNVLTKEEFEKKFIEFKNGNEKAKEEIINSNVRFIIDLVNKKYSNINIDLKDLISVGIVGLIKALNTYDINREIIFITYASRCIENEILQYIRKYNKIKVECSIETEVANNYNDDRSICIKDMLVDDKVDIEQFFQDIVLKNRIRQIVDTLPIRDRMIIYMYFGFENDILYSQKQIAEYTNLSQSFVSRIIKNSLYLIRQKLKEEGLIEKNINQKIIVRSNK